jgi:transposase InsO family protein
MIGTRIPYRGRLTPSLPHCELGVECQTTIEPAIVRPVSVEPLRFLMLVFSGWVNRHQLDMIEYLMEENRVLREQLGGKAVRFTDTQRRRLAAKGRTLGRRVLNQLGSLVTPDTILRWYRELIAKKYDGTSRRGPGRARRVAAVQDLVVQMARENPGWGYTRIRGALGNLGYQLGRNTIKRILLAHGLEPAPLRGRTMPWKTFLKAHFGVTAAMDFFSVEVLTLTGVVRYMVLFVIDLKSRRVHIAGVVRDPDGAWMNQVARNLTDVVDGFLLRTRYLLHDRDPLFTDAFRTVLRTAGVRCLRLPPSSPNLNAFAERFVLSIKSECLDKLIPLGERHLRRAISEFAEHYHLERNHQGLANELITRPVTPRNDNLLANPPVVRRERMGGLLNFYDRRAAAA